MSEANAASEANPMSGADAAELLAGWPHEFRTGAANAPILLMLHGTGGNEVEITGLVEHLHPNASVLSARGRVQEQGMNRWFRRLGEGTFDVDDVIVRAGELAQFIAAARVHYDLAEVPLIAVGFSNGANIALATALLHPTAIDRVVALSGMFPFADSDPVGDVSTVKLLLLNGSDDQMAPALSVRRLEAVASDHGASVERHERAGGHGITADELAAAREWISAQL